MLLSKMRVHDRSTARSNQREVSTYGLCVSTFLVTPAAVTRVQVLGYNSFVKKCRKDMFCSFYGLFWDVVISCSNTAMKHAPY